MATNRHHRWPAGSCRALLPGVRLPVCCARPVAAGWRLAATQHLPPVRCAGGVIISMGVWWKRKAAGDPELRSHDSRAASGGMSSQPAGGVEQGYGRKSAEATGMLEGDRPYQAGWVGRCAAPLDRFVCSSKRGLTALLPCWRSRADAETSLRSSSCTLQHSYGRKRPRRLWLHRCCFQLLTLEPSMSTHNKHLLVPAGCRASSPPRRSPQRWRACCPPPRCVLVYASACDWWGRLAHQPGRLPAPGCPPVGRVRMHVQACCLAGGCCC